MRTIYREPPITPEDLATGREILQRATAACMISLDDKQISADGTTITKQVDKMILTIRIGMADAKNMKFFVRSAEAMPDGTTKVMSEHTCNAETLHSILLVVSPPYLSTFGTIEKRSAFDRWGNAIDTIRLPASNGRGEAMMMNRIALPSHNKGSQRYRIKMENLKGVWRLDYVISYDPETDIDTLKIGRYSLAWKNGELIANETDGDCSPLDDILLSDFDPESDDIILEILGQIADNPLVWTPNTSPHARHVAAASRPRKAPVRRSIYRRRKKI